MRIASVQMGSSEKHEPVLSVAVIIIFKETPKPNDVRPSIIGVKYETVNLKERFALLTCIKPSVFNIKRIRTVFNFHVPS